MDPIIESYVRDALSRSTTELSPDATDSEIHEYLQQFDSNQANGIVNNIKGIVHEEMYVDMENSDGDYISAAMHGSINTPGSDIVLTDHLAGTHTEIQLKATDSASYIHDALERYPEIDVMATNEVAQQLGVESTGISNGWLTESVNESLGELGLEGFEPTVSEYILSVDQPMDVGLAIMTDSTDTEQILRETLGSDFDSLISAGAAGGYFVLLDYLKEKPHIQEKVMRAGLGLGILDGFVGSEGLTGSFEMNPLLIASIASWISVLANNSSKEGTRAFGRVFNGVAHTTLLTTTKVGYGAMALVAADFILPGIDIIDSLGDAIEAADCFDLIDGVELIESFASFGVSIMASQMVGKYLEEKNAPEREKIKRLQNQIKHRNIQRAMLKSNAPVPLLMGPLAGLR